MSMPIQVKQLGLTDYASTWQAMQSFTAQRNSLTADEIWLTEHPAIYTLGLNRKQVRLPSRQDIPLLEVDRGGKITYHGHGQAVVYLLVDLKRRGLNIRQLVSMMENAIIALLVHDGIDAQARADAPGVYVQDKKIASLGLRLKNMCCYHGLSVNVHMDLTPFNAIDPCGYQGLQVTQLKDLGIDCTLQQVQQTIVQHMLQALENAASISNIHPT
jgi:lipoyl(octanoyl) transferase